LGINICEMYREAKTDAEGWKNDDGLLVPLVKMCVPASNTGIRIIGRLK